VINKRLLDIHGSRKKDGSPRTSLRNLVACSKERAKFLEMHHWFRACASRDDVFRNQEYYN